MRFEYFDIRIRCTNAERAVIGYVAVEYFVAMNHKGDVDVVVVIVVVVDGQTKVHSGKW